MDGRDEMNYSFWVCDQGLYQCNRTGQCIDRDYLCDGEFDCYDGEDEWSCSTRSRQWTLEQQCHNTTEHFCITESTWKIARCIDHVFLLVKWVIITLIVLELVMSVMSSRAEIIECWVIVFCAIIEQNALITCHSATGSMIVWIEQMNSFGSGIEVRVQSDNFLVRI